jgi:hypothetical protein
MKLKIYAHSLKVHADVAGPWADLYLIFRPVIYNSLKFDGSAVSPSSQGYSARLRSRQVNAPDHSAQRLAPGSLECAAQQAD